MAPIHQVSSESACRFGLWSVALQTNRQPEKPDNKGYLTKRIPIIVHVRLGLEKDLCILEFVSYQSVIIVF